MPLLMRLVERSLKSVCFVTYIYSVLVLLMKLQIPINLNNILTYKLASNIWLDSTNDVTISKNIYLRFNVPLIVIILYNAHTIIAGYYLTVDF